jgi:hypothetical protein
MERLHEPTIGIEGIWAPGGERNFLASEWKAVRLRRAPRTVVGYHGCTRETAERVVAGEPFVPSTRRYDWLGVGIYFWEYGPFRAREWAENRFGADAAVLEATLRLGRCLNLMDVEHHANFARAYETTLDEMNQQKAALPENTENGRHYRDRQVVEVYCRLVAEESGTGYQTVRACFPEGEPLFPGSRLLSRTHVQIAVRDRRCITRLRLVT